MNQVIRCIHADRRRNCRTTFTTFDKPRGLVGHDTTLLHVRTCGECDFLLNEKDEAILLEDGKTVAQLG